MLRRRCRHGASKQGTGDDAEASLSALSPLLTRTSVCATAATTIAIAIARASEVQVIMPRHHPLPCCCRQRARASAAATAISIMRASKGQVMMPRHHRPPCCRRRRARASAPPLPPPSRGRVRDRCRGIIVRPVAIVDAHGCHRPPSTPPPHCLPSPPPAVVDCQICHLYSRPH